VTSFKVGGGSSSRIGSSFTLRPFRCFARYAARRSKRCGMNGNIVRKLEQKAIRFATASTANCLLHDHSSFILKPAPTALIFY